jgi:hypothetical protein
MNEISKPTTIETLPNLDETSTSDLKFALYDDDEKANQLSFNDLKNGAIGNIVPRETASLSNNPYAFKEQIVNGATVLYWGEFIDLNKPLPRYYGTSSGRITIVTLTESLNLTWDANVYVNRSNDLLVNESTSIAQPYTIQPFKEITLEFTNCKPTYPSNTQSQHSPNTVYYLINS